MERSETDGNASHRILLVDDDELFRESLLANLEDAGFEVVEATNGQAALDRLTTDPGFDLVLLDWKMPGMNGIEVLRRMREGGIALPVIFLTVLSNQIYEEAALQGGAVDFVEKSRSFAIVLKRMGLILDGAKTGSGGGNGPTTTAPAGGPAPAPASSPTSDALRRGALELRRETSRAFWNEREVPLSITEFKMVDLLATRVGQDIPYRDLYDLVHGGGFVAGYGDEGYRGNVRAFMKRIRRKFREIDADFDEIESYSGFGYRWRDRDQDGDTQAGRGGGSSDS